MCYKRNEKNCLRAKILIMDSNMSYSFYYESKNKNEWIVKLVFVILFLDLHCGYECGMVD